MGLQQSPCHSSRAGKLKLACFSVSKIHYRNENMFPKFPDQSHGFVSSCLNGSDKITPSFAFLCKLSTAEVKYKK